MTNCRECGHQISTSARACPKCGARVPRTKWWLWIPLAGVVAFFAVGFSISSSPDGQARSEQRAAIAACWEGQSKKSLDPAGGRFIAGACEAMEQRFRERWGVSP